MESGTETSKHSSKAYKTTAIALGALMSSTFAVQAQDALEVWSRSGPQAAATYEAVFAAFTEKTGIPVEYLTALQFDTQLQARVAARDLPDVLIYDQSSMAAYATSGWIVPIEPETLAGYEEVSDISWDSVKMANGSTYGVPFSQHAQITFVRKDWREKLGFDVPKTHDDLIALATAFATGDPDGNGVDGDTFGMAVPGTTSRGFFAWWMFSYLAQQGASYVEGGDGKYEVTINNPAGVKAVEWLYDAFCKDPNLAQPGAMTNASATPFFAEGQAGIYQTGPYAITSFTDKIGAENLEIILAPAGSAGSTTLTERTSIYFGATSTLPDEQKALAEFLISQEGQTLGMTAPGQPVVRLPVNTNLVAADIYEDPRFITVAKQLEMSELMPSDIDFTAARLEIAETFQTLFSQCNDDIVPQLDRLAGRISEELEAVNALK
ncbi:carbohydrate ABC transporter substrate-binding protein (CUT1 family) [Pacificibacter maritimus]|uniref:Carbohydrate ABC transporter substrate-binding protein (CUT1 family) n=1 Tax=Pacificibacter maritimus TaxID=762213 RepID=A0A3N4UGM3_9RHOB|nr:extracellular solute-binding protein [Pacificibacter maritimus]RPE66309.1 carbohydrate ABC transporter substrate-binding protein (CUT1 family) [Pacificibacter maritimus]